MKQKKTKIQQIKRVIKIAVASSLVLLLVVLGFFVQYTNQTYENTNMKKWKKLTDSQKITTLNYVVKHNPDSELMLACMNKISTLSDANEMMVRDAAALCYNGIKLNTESNAEPNEK